MESGRRDSDDAEDAAADAQGHTGYGRIGSKSAAPEGVGEYRDWIGAGRTILRGREGAAERGLDAQDIEEFAGYELHTGLGGWASGSIFDDVYGDGLTLGSQKSGEDGIVVAKLHELGVGEDPPLAMLGGFYVRRGLVGVGEQGELLGVRDGQRAQNHGVDDRENRGIGPNAEGEGEDGDQ